MFSYEATLTRLYGLQRFGIKLGLETVSALLSELGNPQRRFHALHVAGTNGKGSVAVMTASILQAAGVRVGLYTSPHLLDFCERIKIQGIDVPRERVVDLFARVQALPSFLVQPTFFEVATVMAFQYFAEEEVEIGVIEVGMGGRFDATNVCHPLGTIITNVSFDHERYLGSSLPDIAFEKAGIIKRRVPVVVGPVERDVSTVLRERAHHQNAPLTAFGKEFLCVAHDAGTFDVTGTRAEYLNLSCSLEGRHQAINAACSIVALESSVMPHRSISERIIRRGLESVTWPGRLERLQRRPLIVCDGAHNPAAAECLTIHLQGLLDERNGRRLIVVIGMMQDKNLPAFLNALVPLADGVILTQIEHPRSAPAFALKRALPVGDVPVYERESPHAAIDLATRLADHDDLVCVTGSLFLVGHVKSLMTGSTHEPVVG